jgi:signal transduction histidine kinase
VREQLLKAVDQVYHDDALRRGRVSVAIHQLLDIELAIMLDSYREDLLERQRAHERLATIGELAASVGHELRNPLGTIESSLFLIRRRLERLGISDQQLDKHHGKVTRQVDHCNDTITRLLDLASDRPPRFEQMSLSALVADVIRTSAFERDVGVEVAVPDDLVVWADPAQLSLVFANLIRNASEASDQQIEVRIAAAEHQGGVVVIVADNGPGVPAEVRPRLFEARFTTRSQGTGLGLALVARIIEAHAGEISLLNEGSGLGPASKAPAGQGATFRFWLPGVPAAQRSERGAE